MSLSFSSVAVHSSQTAVWVGQTSPSHHPVLPRCSGCVCGSVESVRLQTSLEWRAYWSPARGFSGYFYSKPPHSHNIYCIMIIEQEMMCGKKSLCPLWCDFIFLTCSSAGVLCVRLLWAAIGPSGVTGRRRHTDQFTRKPSQYEPLWQHWLNVRPVRLCWVSTP